MLPAAQTPTLHRLAVGSIKCYLLADAMLVMLPDRCVKLHQWIILGPYEFVMITAFQGHPSPKVFLSRTLIPGGPGLMLAIEMVVGKPGQEEMRVGPYGGHEEILASEVVAKA